MIGSFMVSFRVIDKKKRLPSKENRDRESGAAFVRSMMIPIETGEESGVPDKSRQATVLKHDKGFIEIPCPVLPEPE
ncbi:MAG: hypothetical protein HGB15_06690 [Chlorobaculum sp.]|nr:hypothetical protein [Chlorobaculum sp.]